MSRTLAAAALVLIPTSVYAWTKRKDAHGKTVIAYYASWQWYDRDGLAKPSNLDHSKVTRYNFAFFQPNENGDIWGTDSWADSIVLFGEQDWNPPEGTREYCSWDTPEGPPEKKACAARKSGTGLIQLAHDAGVEVYPSIGGWTLSHSFPKLAANSTSRVNFANNCVKLIEAYDFDGIDIDWEYPGYVDHNGTVEDTVNYSLFLEEIRKALDALGEKKGQTYGLTAALPCGPDLIDNIQIDVVNDYLDELNLMTYDFHGAWDEKTGANAPLYDMKRSPNLSVHSCVELWKKGGGRANQINIGLPFYGRSVAGDGLTGFGQKHLGKADLSTWFDDDGSPQYFNILNGLATFTTVWDEQTRTVFAYSSTGFVSYDDERAICEKTNYAVNNQLNGFIIWEISGDLLEDGSTPLLDAMHGRLNNPTLNCDDLSPTNSAKDEGDESPTNHNAIDKGKWYPGVLNCTSAFPPPAQVAMFFQTEEECCALYYCRPPDVIWSSPTPPPISSITPPPIFSPTPPPSPSPTPGPLSTYPTLVDVFATGSTPPPIPSPTLGPMSTNPTPVDAFAVETTPSLITQADTSPPMSGVNSPPSLYPIPPPIPIPTLGPILTNPTPVDVVDVVDVVAAETTPSMITQADTSPPMSGVTSPPSSYPIPRPVPSPTSWPMLPNPTPVDLFATETTPTLTTQVEISQETSRPMSGVILDIAGGDLSVSLTGDLVVRKIFYPDFGVSQSCRNDRDVPQWITENITRSSKIECCSSYFSSSLEICNTDHLFYPNFHDKSCANDGKNPKWMGGAYLFETMESCCNKFFRDSDCNILGP